MQLDNESKRSLFVRAKFLVLALLYLTFSIAACAHEFEHSFHKDNDNCNICMTAHQLGTAVISPPPVVAKQVEVVLIGHSYFLKAGEGASFLNGYTAHAPPRA